MTGKSRLHKLVLFFSIAVILVFSYIAFYYGFIVIKAEEIAMDLKVGSAIGFNTDRDALHFGTVYPGTESRRKVIISNNNSFPVLVQIENSGNFSQWVTTESNNFIVEPYEKRGVWYSASPPADAQSSIYLGSSRIIFKRKLI